MLLRKITLKNFLTLYGEQTIEFPETNGHSTALILGPNNSGKSSIVKALQFLLHGRLPNCTEETAWDLISHRHRDEAQNDINADVTATFVIGGNELTVRRAIRARRTGKGRDSFGKVEIAFSYLQGTKTSSKFVPDTDCTIQRRIDVQCPDTLLEAFFFSGEPLDGKLLKGLKHVRESLDEYLSIRHWHNAGEAARELRDHYAAEKQKLARQNRELEGILREEERLQKGIDEKRQQKTTAEETLTTLRASLDEKQAAILAIANQNQMRSDVQERERQTTQLKKHEQSLDSARGEICDAVGKSAGYPFLLRFVSKAQKILGRLREENVLPADLSSPFVERVVAMKACICGRPHTADTRAAWKEYLAKTLQEDVGTKLATLGARVEPDAPNSLQKNVAAIAAQIVEARDRAEADQVAIHALEGTIATLSQRIADSPEEQLRNLELERRKLDAAVKEAEARTERIEKEWKGQVATLKKTKEDRAKIRISPDVAERMKELECYQTRAEGLALLVDEAIAALRRQFHKSLQAAMTTMFDQHVTSGNRAVVSNDTLLPAMENYKGQRVTNPGGGESQLLALSYITAIARLRNALHEGMSQLKIRLGNVGEQVFVLDCPFAKMETHYIQSAIEGLRSAARQIVFLLHGSEWKLAREFLESNAEAAWGVHLHAADSVIKKMKPEDRIYPFRGRNVELASALRSDDETNRSEVKPLTAK